MYAKALLCVIFISIISAWADAQTSEGNNVMLFDDKGINELAQKGLTVSQSGKYSVWVWARGGSSFRLGIGDVWLDKNDFGLCRPFSWDAVGEVELKADQPYSFQVEIRKPDDGKPAVSRLAILPSDFSPQRAFELTRVYPDEPAPLPDKRAYEIRHTDSAFEFPEYDTKEEWTARRSEIRRKILVSAGLLPMPERCPLDAKIVDRLDRDGYTIEKLYIQTWPGVYFPGCLYRPKNGTGPFPAIINPHGHWELGRAAEAVQIRCANFALQGYIAFSYSMIGYMDNDQMEHRFQSDPAYLWSVSIAGLQLWNSIRALDFITSLPEVDLERVACTGCSGGGTQTYMVTAVDDRVKAAAPVNMVSSFFQGGCVCENAPGARLDTYNVEIAACAAPRPMIIIGAIGDWTDLTPEVEYPDVLNIYRLSGDEDKLTYYYQDAGHNYNRNGREAVYKWFDKWLLDEKDTEKLSEIETPVEPIDDLRVFDDEHPRPDDALDQDAIVQSIIAQAKKMLENISPHNEAGLVKFRGTMGAALADVLDVSYSEDVNAILMPYRSRGHARRDKFTATRYVLSRPDAGDQIPAVLYTPRGGAEKKIANLIVHPDGKAAMVDFTTGNPCNMASAMLEADHLVFAIDTFLTGEHPSPFADARRDRHCKHFTTFNPADESLRVQDILTAIAYLQKREDVAGINLIGMGESGLWCLLANAFAPDLNRTVVDVVGFDNRDESAWIEHLNIPGILRVGGFDTAIACVAPRPLLIHNTAGIFDAGRIEELYRMLKADDSLKIDANQDSDQEILNWLKN